MLVFHLTEKTCETSNIRFRCTIYKTNIEHIILFQILTKRYFSVFHPLIGQNTCNVNEKTKAGLMWHHCEEERSRCSEMVISSFRTYKRRVREMDSSSRRQRSVDRWKGAREKERRARVEMCDGSELLGAILKKDPCQNAWSTAFRRSAFFFLLALPSRELDSGIRWCGLHFDETLSPFKATSHFLPGKFHRWSETLMPRLWCALIIIVFLTDLTFRKNTYMNIRNNCYIISKKNTVNQKNNRRLQRDYNRTLTIF